MHTSVATIHAGFVFAVQGAFVPSIQEAVQNFQDADSYLLGVSRAGEGVVCAMERHRAGLMALRRFLPQSEISQTAGELRRLGKGCPI